MGTGTGTPQAPGRAAWALTLAGAAAFAALGLVMVLAPGWAADRFAWSVTGFVAATMGAWSLGNAAVAVLSHRRRTWSVAHPGLVYLWLFAVAEIAVLVAFAGRLRPGHPVAWLYLAALGLTAAGAAAGVAGLLRHRPPWRTPDAPVPPALRLLGLGLVLFAAVLAVGLLRAGDTGASATARLFPEPLSAFNRAAFAALYGTLAVAGLVALLTRAAGPVAHMGRSALALIVPITAVAALHADVFDVAAHPLQWAYPGAYVVAGTGIGLGLLGHRRAPNRTGAA